MVINGLGYRNIDKVIYKSKSMPGNDWLYKGLSFTIYALSLNNRLILYRNFSV